MTALRLSPTRSHRVARGAGTAGRKGSSARREVEVATFYLRLEWLDDPAPFTPAGNAARARGGSWELQPGRQYRVQVQFLSRPTDRTSEAIYAESDLTLALEYLAEGSAEQRSLTIAPDQTGDVPLGEVRDDQTWDVPLSEVRGYSRNFRLTVDPNCCLEEGTLLLSSLSLVDQKFKDRRDLPVDLRLAGSYRNLVSRSLHLKLDQAVAASYIMVHATESENDKVSVIGFKGYDQKYPLQPREPVIRPDVALANLMEVWKDAKKMLNSKEFGRLTRNVWNEVQEFSRKRAPNLLDWLFELIRKDPHAGVVITDYTRFEVPWELIEVFPGSPLGALVPVARWTLVNEYALTEEQFRKGDLNELEAGRKDYARTMRIEPQKTRIGSAVAYLDSSLPNYGHPTLREPLTERCTDMQKLLKRLNKPIDRVCLVYFYSHGEFDDVEFRKTNLGSLWAINFARISPKDQNRPLFFVNACHSGRLTWEGGQAWGLPEALLARVACGYIGTLGPVEQNLATEVAAALLNQAIEGPEPLKPAEALRKLREEARLAHQNNPADTESMARFLHAFMYVYYGNPLASFKLEPPPPSGGSA